MAADIESPGRLGRVTRVENDGQRLYFAFENGLTGTASGEFGFVAEVGDVLIVRDNGLTRAPRELWVDEPWVGVVRLKLDDVAVIVEPTGRTRTVSAPGTAEFSLGNTVQGTDPAGVTRVLSPSPLKHLDLNELIEEDVANAFRVDTSAIPDTLNDFGGSPELLSAARRLVDITLAQHERLVAIGVTPIKGVLFTGEPGVGKTMLARIIAKEADAAFYSVNGPEVLSKWYGQSEELLRKLFEQAKKQEHSIIFFDEIDSIALHRGDDTHEASRRVVAQLLTLMDGFERSDNVIVIAATNRRQDVDAAFTRSGRFDEEIVFPLPDTKAREDILQKNARRYTITGELSHPLVAARTEGWNGAELASILREAAYLTIQDARTSILDEDYIGGLEVAAIQHARRAALTSRREDR